MTHGPILDRTLEPLWLDLALQVALERPGRGARERLETRLRDHVPSAEGRAKTVQALARIWLSPRPTMRPMISWALEQASKLADTRPLHIGALLAAYPFFGWACRVIGRELAMYQDVRIDRLRSSLRKEWADRQVVDVSSRGVIRTLRAFGVLEGDRGSHLSTKGRKLQVDDTLVPWLVHALILTRGIDEIDVRDVPQSPELFMFELPSSGWSSPYPLIERFREGGGRVVLRARRHRPNNNSSDSQQQQLGLPTLG